MAHAEGERAWLSEYQQESSHLTDSYQQRIGPSLASAFDVDAHRHSYVCTAWQLMTSHRKCLRALCATVAIQRLQIETTASCPLLHLTTTCLDS